MNTLDIEKDFLSNVDYLNALADKLKGLDSSNLDSNLVYELHYADLYLENVINLTSDTELLSQIEEIKLVFDSVLNTIPYEKLDSDKTKSSYKNLLKVKYKDVNLGTYTKDVPYTVEESYMRYYLKNRAFKLIETLGLQLLYFSGLVPMFIEFLSKPFGSEELAKQTGEYAYALMESLTSIAGLLGYMLNFVILVYSLCGMLSVILDILYLGFPVMRLMGNEFISEPAKLALQMAETGSTTGYKKVKNFNRISRNESWLISMLSSLEPLKNDEKFKAIYTDLKSLQTDISKYDFSRGRDRKHLYFLYAKIEFLHNEFLSLMKDYSDAEV